MLPDIILNLLSLLLQSVVRFGGIFQLKVHFSSDKCFETERQRLTEICAPHMKGSCRFDELFF